MRYFSSKFAVSLLIFFIFSIKANNILYYAEDANFPNIVFLVDTSGSMETSDPEGKGVKNCLEMAVNLLPKEAKVGLVTYSDNVTINSQLLNESESNITEYLQQITYKGNTNLAAGLEAAVNLLEGQGGNCKIILIADGELYLGSGASQTQAAEAENLLYETLEKAKKSKIIIDTYIISPYFNGNIEKIAQLSRESGGEIKDIKELSDLEKAVESLCLPYYKENFYTITSLSTENEQREVTIPIPTEYISKIKVFFSSETPVSDISFQSYQKESKMISGESFKILIIDKPVKEDLLIKFKSAGEKSIKIYYILSYSVHLEASAEVSANTKDKTQSAILVADVIDDKSGKSILKTGDFSKFRITVQIKNVSSGEEKEIIGKIERGKIVAELPEGWLLTCTAEVNLVSEGLTIVAGTAKFGIEDKLTPLLEEERKVKERAVIIMATALLLLLVIIILLILSIRKP
ncbi:MAG: VWA domain-containing protein, partial [Oscillospiraceae bacterium]|nr:VWA domain-containing protein [Oscillospiraceae bacterium]